MIKVKYYHKGNLLKGFCLSGHADYAEHGKDIVCSAVTSNAIAVINSLDEILKVEFEKISCEDGNIECVVDDNNLEKSQILLMHFQLAVKETKKEYPKNIKILK